jgi:hypothetical protein
MKDVKDGKATWQKMMAARNRKTLILCERCHRLLHTGTLPDKGYFKEKVKGAVCWQTSKHGVRREARYGIPAVSRRN